MAFCLAAAGLSKTFGSRTLFHGVEFSVEERERLALIGPNGSGKSTLLKIIAGIVRPDEGAVTVRKGVRAAYVAQADVFGDGATVLSSVVSALREAHDAGQAPHLHDDHEIELAAELALRRAGFGEAGEEGVEGGAGARLDQPAATLSGGQRKRLAIVRELAKEPDVLLLDEPTNHLDVDGIAWLEELLRGARFASVVVTHDRAFLEAVATRIVELASSYPAGTFSVSGNYTEFLRRKQEFLEGQARQEQALAGLVREDLRWLSRGAQARRTKSKSRASAAHERIDELAELRTRNAPAKAAGIDFTATERKTLKLIQARAITKAVPRRDGDGVAAGGERVLFRDLDVTLSPGDVLGLMGPNGSGKSTLIRVLTGETPPDAPTPEAITAARENPRPTPGGLEPGEIRRADNLRVVVFSQHRTELDPAQTLQEALSPHADSVVYRGRPQHVVTWANRFLFTREQLKSPVRALSGGEQARVHIARLMLEPADVLVLDEPTNDLDIPSLEVLEDSLEEFPGAVLLVTHDRAMLADLATRVLALDGRGGARYFADYDQWALVREREARAAKDAAREGERGRAKETAPAAATVAKAESKKKLSYKEQQELAGMEKEIEKAEGEVRRNEALMADPKVMADHARLASVCVDLERAQARLAALFARWEELEAKK